jgi:hypothetical protein
MKKNLLIIFLILACSTNVFSNEIIFKNCIQGKDGTLKNESKNKEGIRLFDKYEVRINLDKEEVYYYYYYSKEIIDFAKEKNPDFKTPKIPTIKKLPIIYSDDNQINYLSRGNEFKVDLVNKTIRVRFAEPNYFLKCE